MNNNNKAQSVAIHRMGMLIPAYAERRSKHWYGVSTEWQGIWNIYIPEMEGELEALAMRLANLYDLASRGVAIMPNRIGALKSEYSGLDDDYKQAIGALRDAGVICNVCDEMTINEYEDLPDSCACPAQL